MASGRGKKNKLEIDQAPSVSQVFQGRLLNGIKLKTKGSSTYYIITFEGEGGHKMMMVDDVREGGLSK